MIEDYIYFGTSISNDIYNWMRTEIIFVHECGRSKFFCLRTFYADATGPCVLVPRWRGVQWPPGEALRITNISTRKGGVGSDQLYVSPLYPREKRPQYLIHWLGRCMAHIAGTKTTVHGPTLAPVGNRNSNCVNLIASLY